MDETAGDQHAEPERRAEPASEAEPAGVSPITASTTSGDPVAADEGDGVTRLERLLEPGVRIVAGAEQLVAPAWRRLTNGEPRWPASLAVLAAIAMQVALPDRLAFHPRWLLPVVALLLLIGVTAANPRRLNRRSPGLRKTSLVLIALISWANIWSAGRLVLELVRAGSTDSPQELLITGAGIWLTNVIVFALWYWEFDRGGPVERAHATQPYADFLFPQMQSPELAKPGWEAGFVDYLYLSFTNATAFSPTDVLPLSQWSKIVMMLQSTVSLITVALVIARAVNILK